MLRSFQRNNLALNRRNHEKLSHKSGAAHSRWEEQRTEHNRTKINLLLERIRKVV